MSMKKKLKIAGVIFGIFVLIIVFLLCYKAGNHMAERQRQEEQEQLELKSHLCRQKNQRKVSPLYRTSLDSRKKSLPGRAIKNINFWTLLKTWVIFSQKSRLKR